MTKDDNLSRFRDDSHALFRIMAVMRLGIGITEYYLWRWGEDGICFPCPVPAPRPHP